MSFHCFFGVPGSGKSTHAAMITYKCLKKGIPVFSNVEIKGAYDITKTDIGQFQISNCVLIIDEAGIDFNSRNYKSLQQNVIEWFKLYRHYGVKDIYVYSQSWEDYDITLRRLTDKLYIMRRSIIPHLFYYKDIHIKIDIDDNTHQIIDSYSFLPFSRHYFIGSKYWFMFDSWTNTPLPYKDYTLNGFNSTLSAQLEPKTIYKSLKILKRKNKLFYKLLASIKRLLKVGQGGREKVLNTK